MCRGLTPSVHRMPVTKGGRYCLSTEAHSLALPVLHIVAFDSKVKSLGDAPVWAAESEAQGHGFFLCH